MSVKAHVRDTSVFNVALDDSAAGTDELGFNIADRPVYMHDIQAIILRLLGLEHTRLTYRFQSPDYRLTDVFGEIVPEFIA